MRYSKTEQLAVAGDTVTVLDAETIASPEPAETSTAHPDDTAPGGDFIVEGGLAYAGHHLIADFFGAEKLNDIDAIEAAMRDAAEAAGATLLGVKLHHFSPYEGVTGIALLAESHISIHTWPEREFAALDVFMCGGTEPMRAIEVLRDRLKPVHVTLAEHKRGVTT
ncbi:adenosylmethionine decarboxylase [Rhodothalassium salexigens]|uniref:adenosylmethionine decarboxylase n=1 Tax=Rhodothalassium salexigens TaxID=1086 RepID=UPI001912C268|nr:adenosylmethionine decarboxylase [Rhodothalassium salexigens]MBK5910501.1 adenosylmethionine decarboxylase [Rhodothalassium salexigens]